MQAQPTEPIVGSVDPQLLDEFPGLDVVSVSSPIPTAKTPRGLAQELELAANRIRGATAVRASTGSIASAYRGFIRQLGMDPDRVPATVEAISFRRLIEGGFVAAGLAADAVALATIEFEVPITVLNDAGLHGPINLGKAPESSPFYAVGDLVLVDSLQVVSRIFGEPLPEFQPKRSLGAARLVAIAAPGVELELARAALERACELIASS